MAPLYRPPTKVVTTEIPFLTLVTRADPDWARDKYRQLEYEFPGGWRYPNPYSRWPFDAPAKTTVTNYAGPATFAAGDLTGQGEDYVVLNNTNDAPGTLTTRTAVQMFGDITNAAPGLTYAMRVMNSGEGSALALAAGAGVALVSAIEILRGTFSDFAVYMPTPTDVVIIARTTGNPIASVTP